MAPSRDELLAVLKPFADEASTWNPEHNAGYAFNDSHDILGEHSLRLGHLRAARRAYEELSKEGDGRAVLAEREACASIQPPTSETFSYREDGYAAGWMEAVVAFKSAIRARTKP